MTPIRDIALVFLKLGTVGFGGPAAHVALFEDEVVKRRQWLSRDRFLDLLAAANLIPGPNSTEMAIYVGRERAGWLGMIVAGASFILPAYMIVLALAWVYVRFQKLPVTEAVLYGVKPVILAVVVQALWRLGPTAIKSRFLAIVGLAACIGAMLNAGELRLLLAAGAVSAVWQAGCRGRASGMGSAAMILAMPGGAAGTLPAATAFGLWPLFAFFMKVGAVLYGSGYVLLAFLRGDLVERWGWLTESQLLDAIAVGQVTPGPLFTAATFIGYILGAEHGGPWTAFWAATLATVGIFLPGFIFVGVSGPLIPMIRRSRMAGAFLDGVVVASLALMAVVTVQLGRAAIQDWTTAGIAALAAVALIRFRANSAWLVLAGAVLGVGGRMLFTRMGT